VSSETYSLVVVRLTLADRSLGMANRPMRQKVDVGRATAREWSAARGSMVEIWWNDIATLNPGPDWVKLFDGRLTRLKNGKMAYIN